MTAGARSSAITVALLVGPAGALIAVLFLWPLLALLGQSFASAEEVRVNSCRLRTSDL